MLRKYDKVLIGGNMITRLKHPGLSKLLLFAQNERLAEDQRRGLLVHLAGCEACREVVQGRSRILSAKWRIIVALVIDAVDEIESGLTKMRQDERQAAEVHFAWANTSLQRTRQLVEKMQNH